MFIVVGLLTVTAPQTGQDGSLPNVPKKRLTDSVTKKKYCGQHFTEVVAPRFIKKKKGKK